MSQKNEFLLGPFFHIKLNAFVAVQLFVVVKHDNGAPATLNLQLFEKGFLSEIL